MSLNSGDSKRNSPSYNLALIFKIILRDFNHFVIPMYFQNSLNPFLWYTFQVTVLKDKYCEQSELGIERAR